MSRVDRFVPQRLVEAREALGLTGVGLAQIVNLSAVTISAYENKRFLPKADTLQRIAETLKFPVSFFTMPYPLVAGPERPVFWRKLSSATKAARLKCHHRLSWMIHISAYLRQFLDFPTLTLPRLTLPAPVFELTAEQIEALAQEARAAFGLSQGPIQDVLLLMENAGIVISRFEFEADELDAFSHWAKDGLPYVALSNEKRSLAREHANAAHELAHLLLHSELHPSEARKVEHHRILENQAKHFASAFLLPAESFTSELWAPTFSAFESLKPRWRVSMGMMLGRCAELGILTEEQERRMWIQYARLGYKRKEPLDDQMPEVAPRLLRRSLEMLVDQDIRSRDDIRAELSLPDGIIESLCSLKPGYLTDSVTPTVLELPKVRESSKPEQQAPAEGRTVVLPFAKER